MADFKAYLTRLNHNLNILREREARYGGNAPVELLNQIEDHQTAVALTEQAVRSEPSETEWREALKPLLISLNGFGDFFARPIPWQYPPVLFTLPAGSENWKSCWSNWNAMTRNLVPLLIDPAMRMCYTFIGVTQFTFLEAASRLSYSNYKAF